MTDTTQAEEPSGAQRAFGDFAPALAGFTDDVLFRQVWTRPGLSARDRSLYEDVRRTRPSRILH